MITECWAEMESVEAGVKYRSRSLFRPGMDGEAEYVTASYRLRNAESELIPDDPCVQGLIPIELCLPPTVHRLIA